MTTFTRRRLLITFIFIVTAITGITTIGSYDYYWHLSAGRWIAEHRALPLTDPFAVASDRTPWLDGEWLFQLPLYAAHQLGGEGLVTAARALGVATLILFLFLVVERQAGGAVAAAVVSVAYLGADHRLGFRPETAATALAVLAVALLLQRPFSWRYAGIYLVVSALWINVHPSALLAPVLAAAAFAGTLPDSSQRETRRRRALLIPASAAVLLLNPWGIDGVTGPLRLSALVQSGAFVNTEWLPSSPLTFPMLYLTAAGSLLLLIRVDDKRLVAERILILLLFSFLAFRFVRNQGFFFMTMPLLVAPALPRLTERRSQTLAALLATVCLLVLVAKHGGLKSGPDRRMFPVSAVAGLRAAGLTGNIYNPDQFGGYLIWNFYPERRTLTDGRNELYRSYLAEYAVARIDGRAWAALLRKYRIALAVDEFHSEHLDVVDAVTGQHKQLPASLIYFPRSQWALIGFDDVSMVFAKRSEFPAGTLKRLEFPAIVPDGRDPLLSRTPEGLSQARRDVERARGVLGESRIIRHLERQLSR